MPVLGFRRGPPHGVIAANELQVQLSKNTYKTRSKERKLREKYEKQELKAKMKHAEELTKLQLKERGRMKQIMKRARA